MRNPNALLATSFAATAILAGGCAESPTEYEKIRVPAGTTDLRESSVNRGEYSPPTRSFLVRAEKAGDITCGAVLKLDQRYEPTKIVRVIGGDPVLAQVDCIEPSSDYPSHVTEQENGYFKGLEPVVDVAPAHS